MRSGDPLCWLMMTLVAAGLVMTGPRVGSAQQQPTNPVTTPTSPATTDIESTVRQAIRALDEAQKASDAATRQVALDEAQRLVDEIRRVGPHSAWNLYFRGRASLLQGRPSEALDDLTRFVETREGRNEWTAYLALGNLLVDAYPALAQPKYEQAAYLKTNEPDIALGLARCALALGDNDKAVEQAKLAVEWDHGRQVKYLNELANTLLQAGQPIEAYKQANYALERAWQQVHASPGEATRLTVLDAQYELILTIVLRQLREAPQNPEIYRLAGHWQRERAEVTKQLALVDAVATLEQGLQRAGRNPSPDLLAEYAGALTEVGRVDEAASVYQQLYQIAPDHPALKQSWQTPTPPAPAGDEPDSD